MSGTAWSRDELAMRVGRAIRDIPDFPKPGIVFKDITPVLASHELFSALVDDIARRWSAERITHVAGIESRGFILAAPVAIAVGAGLIPIRKPGKLPFRTYAREYALEYGTDRLEIHVDACPNSARVLVVDDVLATGGTADTACRLIEEAGGEVVGCEFLICIGALGGAARLGGRRVEALLEC